MERKYCFFTIITVCYNDKLGLIKTIDSIRSQSFSNFEHIIIDGNSNDGTKEYLNYYESNRYSIRYISEVDKGIYDAMNKGVLLAEGKYVIFMNAGDVFYNERVLENTLSNIDEYKDNIIFGNCIIKNNYNNKIIKNQRLINKKELIIGKTICHQTIFFKNNIIKRLRFSEDYKFCSDYEHLIILSKDYDFKFVDEIICIYDNNGITSNNKVRKKIMKEREKIIFDNLGIIAAIKCMVFQRFISRLDTRLKRLNNKIFES